MVRNNASDRPYSGNVSRCGLHLTVDGRSASAVSSSVCQMSPSAVSGRVKGVSLDWFTVLIHLVDKISRKSLTETLY
jgi:hypothetical protein